MITQTYPARALALLLGAALFGSGLAGCRRDSTPTPGATPPEDAAAPSIVDAGAPSPEINATDGGPAAPVIPCLNDAMTKLEPHSKWLARFEGSPPADKQPPPRLGKPKDLDKVPQSQLAFVNGGRIFAIDLPEGASRPLTAGPDDTKPVWSPRGTQLAFVRDDHAHLVRADGSDLRQLSTSEVRSDLSFSADGHYLAFFSAETIVLHDLETSAERRLAIPSAPVGVEQVGPVFEPSGSHLAFARNREVYVADAVSGNIERHEWGERNEILSLAFSSDSLVIALNEAPERPRQTVVKRLRLDHKGKLIPEMFPTHSVEAYVGLFAAPKGTRIAMMNDSPAAMATKQPDGTTALEFGSWFHHDVSFYDPAHPTGSKSNLLCIGGGFPEPRFSVESPAWAPDGRHLGFVMKIWQDPSDSEPIAEGIVAIDTDRPSMMPVFVACGDSPTWGPPAK